MKNFLVFSLMMLCIMNNVYSKDKNFTFINKTPDKVTLKLSPPIATWRMISGSWGLFSKYVEVKTGESVTTESFCIDRIDIAIDLPFLQTSLFTHTGTVPENYNPLVYWRHPTLWHRFITRCSGTAEIIKKGKRYSLKWIK